MHSLNISQQASRRLHLPMIDWAEKMAKHRDFEGWRPWASLWKSRQQQLHLDCGYLHLTRPSLQRPFICRILIPNSSPIPSFVESLVLAPLPFALQLLLLFLLPRWMLICHFSLPAKWFADSVAEAKIWGFRRPTSPMRSSTCCRMKSKLGSSSDGPKSMIFPFILWSSPLVREKPNEAIWKSRYHSMQSLADLSFKLIIARSWSGSFQWNFNDLADRQTDRQTGASRRPSCLVTWYLALSQRKPLSNNLIA